MNHKTGLLATTPKGLCAAVGRQVLVDREGTQKPDRASGRRAASHRQFALPPSKSEELTTDKLSPKTNTQRCP